MNINPKNILPAAVRHCSMLSTIQMFFEFIDRRHFENANSEASIQSAEDYLAEIENYVQMCSQYTHLHESLDIAKRYLSVSKLLVKQLKGEF